MKQRDPIIKLYKKSALFTIVGIAVISSLIALLTVYPFYNNLIEDSDEDFNRFSKSLNNQVQSYLTQITDIALQITSRTKARDTLVDYNEKKIDYRNANEIIENILIDVPSRSPIVLGVSRFSIHGELVSSIGEKLPTTLLDQSQLSESEIRYYLTYFHPKEPIFILDAPIKDRDNRHVGNDLILFQTSQLRELLKQSTETYTGSNVLLSYSAKDGLQIIRQFGANISGSNRFSHEYSFQNTNLTLTVSIDKKELYALPNAELIRMLSLLFSVLLFGSLGIFLLSRQFLKNLSLEITLREIREKELAELNQTLQERVEAEVSNRQKQEQLLIQQSKMAAMGEMIGAIAHQLKQPIQAISLTAQSIDDIIDEDKNVKEELLDIEKTICQYTNNMSEIIEDFRNFFKPSYKVTTFKVCELAKDVYSLIEGKMKKYGVELQIDKHECITTTGLPNEFKQVILNIYNNACDIFEERHIKRPKIEICFQKTATSAIMYIRDNGGGIPEELLPDKLFQAYVSTKNDKGTGIGLQISKTIIEEKFKGKLWAHNVEGGAEFVIELPLYSMN